jgi:hypothetical protein
VSGDAKEWVRWQKRVRHGGRLRRRTGAVVDRVWRHLPEGRRRKRVGAVVLGSGRAHQPAHGEKRREQRREEGVQRPACTVELRRGRALAQTVAGLTGARVDDGGAAGGDLHRKRREVRRPATGARGGRRRRRLPRDGWRRLWTALSERSTYKGMMHRHVRSVRGINVPRALR